jgi:hypothetical protein
VLLIDIYIVGFLVLAVFIFLRLRSVLGQRTGRERPPYDPRTRLWRFLGDPSIHHEAAQDGNLAKLTALLKRNPNLVFSKDSIPLPSGRPRFLSALRRPIEALAKRLGMCGT